MPSVQVIDPRSTPAWDDFVSLHPQATVFHTTAWARVLAEAYRYEPYYHVLMEASGDIVAGVPLSLVSSWLTGRRLVGLPFSDFCPPLTRDGAGLSPLLEALQAEVQHKRVSYVEMRGSCSDSIEDRGFDGRSHFVRHVIRLDVPEEELHAQLHTSARRGVRKAEREGVRVRSSTSPEDMRIFYRLHVATRRKHGVVPAPYRFFQGIQEHFLADGSGCLLMADLQGRTIAADLLLWRNGQLVYKYNVSDDRFLGQRPNNALMWRALHLGRELGCSQFDLGRTEVANAGLCRFKSLWGSEALPLSYYYYPSARGVVAANPKGILYIIMAAAVRLTPPLLLPRAGALVYRHLG